MDLKEMEYKMLKYKRKYFRLKNGQAGGAKLQVGDKVILVGNNANVPKNSQGTVIKVPSNALPNDQHYTVNFSVDAQMKSVIIPEENLRKIPAFAKYKNGYKVNLKTNINQNFKKGDVVKIVGDAHYANDIISYSITNPKSGNREMVTEDKLEISAMNKAMNESASASASFNVANQIQYNKGTVVAVRNTRAVAASSPLDSVIEYGYINKNVNYNDSYAKIKLNGSVINSSVRYVTELLENVDSLESGKLMTGNINPFKGMQFNFIKSYYHTTDSGNQNIIYHVKDSSNNEYVFKKQELDVGLNTYASASATANGLAPVQNRSELNDGNVVINSTNPPKPIVYPIPVTNVPAITKVTTTPPPKSMVNTQPPVQQQAVLSPSPVSSPSPSASKSNKKQKVVQSVNSNSNTSTPISLYGISPFDIPGIPYDETMDPLAPFGYRSPNAPVHNSKPVQYKPLKTPDAQPQTTSYLHGMRPEEHKNIKPPSILKSKSSDSSDSSNLSPISPDSLYKEFNLPKIGVNVNDVLGEQSKKVKSPKSVSFSDSPQNSPRSVSFSASPTQSPPSSQKKQVKGATKNQQEEQFGVNK